MRAFIWLGSPTRRSRSCRAARRPLRFRSLLLNPSMPIQLEESVWPRVGVTVRAAQVPAMAEYVSLVWKKGRNRTCGFEDHPTFESTTPCRDRKGIQGAFATPAISGAAGERSAPIRRKRMQSQSQSRTEPVGGVFAYGRSPWSIARVLKRGPRIRRDCAQARLSEPWMVHRQVNSPVRFRRSGRTSLARAWIGGSVSPLFPRPLPKAGIFA